MNKTEFGLWIKSIRVECDYTQHKLATLLGFNNSQSIANIESGRATLPKHCYKKFVDIFRLDAEQFIDAVMTVKRTEVSNLVYGRKEEDSK